MIQDQGAPCGTGSREPSPAVSARIIAAVSQYRDAPFRSADWLAGELMTILDSQPTNDNAQQTPIVSEVVADGMEHADQLWYLAYRYMGEPSLSKSLKEAAREIERLRAALTCTHCTHCGKRLSRKTARQIDGVVMRGTCMFKPASRRDSDAGSAGDPQGLHSEGAAARAGTASPSPDVIIPVSENGR